MEISWELQGWKWLAKQSWSPSIPDKLNWILNKFSYATRLWQVWSLTSRELEAVEDSKPICINPQMKGSSAGHEASEQTFLVLVFFFCGESMAGWHKKQASLMSHQTLLTLPWSVNPAVKWKTAGEERFLVSSTTVLNNFQTASLNQQDRTKFAPIFLLWKVKEKAYQKTTLSNT